MTELEPPPLPQREQGARTPSSWSVCDRCGGVYADTDVHIQWHDAVEGRAQRALDLARSNVVDDGGTI